MALEIRDLASRKINGLEARVQYIDIQEQK